MGELENFPIFYTTNLTKININQSTTKLMEKTVKNLKKGFTVEIKTAHGTCRGVVQKTTESLAILTLLKPMTSEKSHSYHWGAGELKSFLYKNMLSLKRLDFNQVN
tara:strand:+ start:564 stop:881 length:318 start_codon:yes stop_codon:yes gene_type:complete